MNNTEQKEKYDELLTEYSSAVTKVNYARQYVDTVLANEGPYDKEYFAQAEYLKSIDLEKLAKELLQAEKLYFITIETQDRVKSEKDEVQKQNHEKIFSYL